MLYEFDQQQLENFPNFATGEPTDEELMAGIKARKESALAALLRRHTPLLRTIIARVVNNDHDVDDLIQEVFIEIWRQADHYVEDKGKALGWIVTLARRRAIDKLRKKQAYFRAEERLRQETEKDPEPQMHHSADDEVIASDTAQVFQKIIATLPEAQREALHLAFDPLGIATRPGAIVRPTTTAPEQRRRHSGPCQPTDSHSHSG